MNLPSWSIKVSKDGDDALGAVTCRRVALHEFKPPLVDGRLVPFDGGEKTIQARRIGGLGKFAVDASDGFIRGDHQAGEILGEMPTLRLTRKQIAEFTHGFAYHFGKLHNRRHGRTLRGSRVLPRLPTPDQNTRI